jgi:hypothetical protein
MRLRCVTQPSVVWTETSHHEPDSIKEVGAVEVGQEISPSGLLVFKHLPPAYFVLGIDYDEKPAIHCVEISAFVVLDAEIPSEWMLSTYMQGPYSLVISPKRWGDPVRFLARVAAREVTAMAALLNEG